VIELAVTCVCVACSTGAVREMAALLLARLLTRPDMTAALSDFVSWQQQALAGAQGPQTVFLLPGILQTLAQVYKLGRREQLLQWAPVVWQQLSALLAVDTASGLASNALARKLAVKLTQRLGLVMLPPQLAGWRYVRAAEDMASNLSAAAADCGGNSGPQGQHPAGSGATNGTSTSGTATTNGRDSQDRQQQDKEREEGGKGEPAHEIPAEIEDVLGVLLGSCSDRDTVVRWSAAKGVGRLAACLPPELAEEVVLGVLGLLSPAGAQHSCSPHACRVWCEGRKEDWFCPHIGERPRRTATALVSLPVFTALSCFNMIPPLLRI